MSRAQFVAETIGREIRRACIEYVGEPSIADAFDALDHDRTPWVEVRWWRGESLQLMNRYGVTDIASNRPPVGPNDYEPDAELPASPGCDLQVAVYPAGCGPDHRMLIAFAPVPDSERASWRIVDQALGVTLLEETT